MTAGYLSGAPGRGRRSVFMPLLAGVDKLAARDIFDDICAILDANAEIEA
ncbi:MAG: hypothetical protein U0992_18390 [Planctomycetaceae bacterium]